MQKDPDKAGSTYKLVCNSLLQQAVDFKTWRKNKTRPNQNI